MNSVPLFLCGGPFAPNACEDALREAADLAPHLPVRAAVDVAVGVELLHAARRACRMCIVANAAALTDAAVVGRITMARERADAAIDGHVERWRTTLRSH